MEVITALHSQALKVQQNRNSLKNRSLIPQSMYRYKDPLRKNLNYSRPYFLLILKNLVNGTLKINSFAGLSVRRPMTVTFLSFIMRCITKTDTSQFMTSLCVPSVMVSLILFIKVPLNSPNKYAICGEKISARNFLKVLTR